MPIWRNPPNLPASPQIKQRKRERVGGECTKKRTRKKNRREGGGGKHQNKRTSETHRKVGISCLAAAEGNIQTRFQTIRGDFSLYVLIFPSPARLVECRLRTIPVLKTLKSINNTEGAETTGLGVELRRTRHRFASKKLSDGPTAHIFIRDS